MPPRKRLPGKSPVPPGLMEAGTTLWTSITADRELDAASRVLLVNACRIADRLDQLDTEIDGRLLSYNQRGDEVINPLISEHRQQYTALANILGKMGLGELPKPKSGESKWDELAKKRAERAAKAAEKVS
ncbi:terminase small subunit [Mycobacterium phage Archie]|uniref:Terminase small subunit n=1 Tax=Mycobacterium phage Archie TaxID=1718599 RepID=A0A0M5M739_9CAUD|nr:terminase small subunit [Mycobacterium phage Archie]ALF00308.1 terminase small subunit [Mycobacterium phage Archie]